jgi:hypothetical protein
MLDEAFLDDPKMEDLQIELGIEGIGFYVVLLTVFREHSATGYRIPYDRLNIIADRRMHLTDAEKERFSIFMAKAIEIGLLQESEEGDFFWSERRRIDLLKQEELRKKQSLSGKETMEKRYGKSNF